MLGWLNLETHLGPEDKDHGDGGAELGAGKGEEVLHVGAAVGQDQHTEGHSNVTILELETKIHEKFLITDKRPS